MLLRGRGSYYAGAMPLVTLRRRPPDQREAVRRARDSRADRIEKRLAVPVIIAAGATVPAVFLSVVAEGTAARAGTVLNWASLMVLTAESVLLFLLTGHRLAWIWRHRWTLGILAVAVPAMIFLAVPAQAIRFIVWAVRFFGTLRILRAGRIIKAGRVVARRIGWDGKRRYVPVFIGSVLAAIFVAVVLSDPSSRARTLLDRLDAWPRALLGLLAAAVLAVVTPTVIRNRRRVRASVAGGPEHTDPRGGNDSASDHQLLVS